LRYEAITEIQLPLCEWHQPIVNAVKERGINVQADGSSTPMVVMGLRSDFRNAMPIKIETRGTKGNEFPYLCRVLRLS